MDTKVYEIITEGQSTPKQARLIWSKGHSNICFGGGKINVDNN